MCCEKMTVKKCLEYEVDGQRPKRTWREVVEKDCQARKLNKEDATDHCRWRNDGSPGQKSVKRLCVCNSFFVVWYAYLLWKLQTFESNEPVTHIHVV